MKTFASILLLGLPWLTFSQQRLLLKSATSTSGNNLTSTSKMYSLSQTIAQPSLTGAFSKNKIHILQGFQQPYLGNSRRIVQPGITFTVFPNPSFGEFAILLALDITSENLWLTITDGSGRVVIETTAKQKNNRLHINVAGIASGVYQLYLRDDRHQRGHAKLILY